MRSPWGVRIMAKREMTKEMVQRIWRMKGSHRAADVAYIMGRNIETIRRIWRGDIHIDVIREIESNEVLESEMTTRMWEERANAALPRILESLKEGVKAPSPYAEAEARAKAKLDALLGRTEEGNVSPPAPHNPHNPW